MKSVPKIPGVPRSYANRVDCGRRAWRASFRWAAWRRDCGSPSLGGGGQDEEFSCGVSKPMLETQQMVFFRHLCSGPGRHSGWCEGSGASPSTSSCDLWSLHLQEAQKGKRFSQLRQRKARLSLTDQRGAAVEDKTRCRRACSKMLLHKSRMAVCVAQPVKFFFFSYTIACCTAVNELFIATGTQVSKACGTTLLSHSRYSWWLRLGFRLLSTWRN